MDQELEQRFATLEEKINKIYISVEKTRKYFLWTLIISVALFVLPAIGLAFAIPAFLNNYVAPIQNLSNLTQ
jgi:type IV secretory pathway component VirB8